MVLYLLFSLLVIICVFGRFERTAVIETGPYEFQQEQVFIGGNVYDENFFEYHSFERFVTYYYDEQRNSGKVGNENSDILYGFNMYHNRNTSPVLLDLEHTSSYENSMEKVTYCTCDEYFVPKIFGFELYRENLYLFRCDHDGQRQSDCYVMFNVIEFDMSDGSSDLRYSQNLGLDCYAYLPEYFIIRVYPEYSIALIQTSAGDLIVYVIQENFEMTKTFTLSNFLEDDYQTFDMLMVSGGSSLVLGTRSENENKIRLHHFEVITSIEEQGENIHKSLRETKKVTFDCTNQFNNQLIKPSNSSDYIILLMTMDSYSTTTFPTRLLSSNLTTIFQDFEWMCNGDVMDGFKFIDSKVIEKNGIDHITMTIVPASAGMARSDLVKGVIYLEFSALKTGDYSARIFELDDSSDPGNVRWGSYLRMFDENTFAHPSKNNEKVTSLKVVSLIDVDYQISDGNTWYIKSDIAALSLIEKYVEDSSPKKKHEGEGHKTLPSYVLPIAISCGSALLCFLCLSLSFLSLALIGILCPSLICIPTVLTKNKVKRTEEVQYPGLFSVSDDRTGNYSSINDGDRYLDKPFLISNGNSQKRRETQPNREFKRSDQDAVDSSNHIIPFEENSSDEEPVGVFEEGGVLPGKPEDGTHQQRRFFSVMFSNGGGDGNEEEEETSGLRNEEDEEEIYGWMRSGVKGKPFDFRDHKFSKENLIESIIHRSVSLAQDKEEKKMMNYYAGLEKIGEYHEELARREDLELTQYERLKHLEMANKSFWECIQHYHTKLYDGAKYEAHPYTLTEEGDVMYPLEETWEDDSPVGEFKRKKNRVLWIRNLLSALVLLDGGLSVGFPDKESVGYICDRVRAHLFLLDYSQGVRSLKKRNCIDMENDANSAIQKIGQQKISRTKFIRLYLLRAKARVELGKLEECISDARQFLKGSNGSTGMMFGHKDVYFANNLISIAKSMQKNGLGETDAPYCTMGLISNMSTIPRSKRVEYDERSDRVSISKVRRDYHLSLNEALKNVEIAPIEPKALYEVAIIYHYLGEIDKSLEYCQKVIELARYDYVRRTVPLAHELMSAMYTTRRQFHKAMMELNKMEEFMMKDPEIHFSVYKTMILQRCLHERVFLNGICKYISEDDDEDEESEFVRLMLQARGVVEEKELKKFWATPRHLRVGYENTSKNEGLFRPEKDATELPRFGFLCGQNQYPLKGCHHDVNRMEKKLREKFGYDCSKVFDVTAVQFVEELEIFSRKVQCCESNEKVKVLVYFSGHGMEKESESLLCCFENSVVKLKDVIMLLDERIKRICDVVIILDCCRKRVDVEEKQKSGSWIEAMDEMSLAFEKNLFVVDSCKNTFIVAFSCQSGDVAQGGARERDLSSYTSELLSSLQKEGQTVLEVLDKARRRLISRNRVLENDEDKQVANLCYPNGRFLMIPGLVF